MKIIAVMFIAILAFQSLKAIETYRITAHVKNLEDLSSVKNCLSYSLCGESESGIAGSFGNFRYHHHYKLNSPEPLKQAINNCYFNQKKIKIQLLKKDEDKNYMPISFQYEFKGNDTINQYTNVRLKKIKKKKLKKFYSKARVLLENDETRIAYEEFVQLFNLNDHNYNIRFNVKMDKAAAVVNHGEEALTFAPWNEDEDICSYFYRIRHELEHISQYKRALKCATKNTSHHFFDHIQRERSAYLNDILNIRKVCLKPDTVNQIILGSFEKFLSDYTH